MLKHFLVISGGTIISMIIGLITTPIITRIVEPADYGRYSIFLMYGSIVLMVLCLGLDQALVRYYYHDDSIEFKGKLLQRCSVIPIVITLIVLLGATLLHHFFTFSFSVGEWFFLCIYILLQVINRFSTLLLRLEYKSKIYSLVNVVYKILYVLLSLFFLLIFRWEGTHSLIIATLFSYFVATSVAIFYEKEIWSSAIKKNNYKMNIEYGNLIKYGLPFILSMGINSLFQYLDKIFLNIYSGYQELGVYASANSVMAAFSIVQSTFNALWLPMAIKHYEEMPSDKELYKKAFSMISFVMFFIGMMLMVFKDFFVLLLGEKYRQAAFVIPFLMFYPIMYTISEVVVVGVVFAEKSKLHIWIATIACIFNLVGNALLVPHFGGKGAAISTGLSYIVFWVVRLLLSQRYYYIDYDFLPFNVFMILIIGYALAASFISGPIMMILGWGLIAILFIIYHKTVISMFVKASDYLRLFRKDNR